MGVLGVQGTRQLTDLQERFVEAYLKRGLVGAKDAALDAGYSEASAKNMGPRLARNELVQQEIRRRARAISGGAEISAEEVVEGLREIATNTAMNERARVMAWTTLGKYTGGFEPKRQIDLNGEITISRGTPKLSG